MSNSFLTNKVNSSEYKIFKPQIEAWNNERFLLNNNEITSYRDLTKEISFLLEETSELFRASSEEEVIDALCDVVIFSMGFLLKIEKVIQETITDEFSKVNSSISSVSDVMEIISKTLESQSWNKVKDLHLKKLIVGQMLNNCMADIINSVSEKSLDTLYATLVVGIEITFMIIRKVFGYDAKVCMEETMKEISSRKGMLNPSTGKWEKFTTDEAKALWISADYSKAKLKN